MTTPSSRQDAAPAKRVRDVRLDFFRGLSLFIILVSHTPGDALSNWIPARFGLSDAADMFVFVSGYAGSIAFGGVYRRRGWLMGTARIGLRLWQLYIAQLAIVLAAAALVVASEELLGADAIPDGLFTLDHLFTAPREALLGIVTLTYVPHYLDILPVYIVVLAMVPIAIALAKIRPWLVPVASLALWAAANGFDWNLPNEPAAPRGWFFDPFCWQLLFFSGFSIGMGWLKTPGPSRALITICALWLLFGVSVTVPTIFTALPGWVDVQGWIVMHADKTALDMLQYLHFLALAYVVVRAVDGRLHWLSAGWARPIVACGRQALSVFLSGILLAYVGGLGFAAWGTDPGAQLGVNALLFAATLAVAYGVAWMKAAPWTKPASPRVPVVSATMDGALAESARS